MRKILLISLLLFSSTAFAQTWGTYGTTWSTGILESFFSANQGYIQTIIIGDTTLLTQQCKILQSNHYNSSGQLVLVDTAFLYKSNNKIFCYLTNTFYTLYDFNASVGDTWQTIAPYPSPFSSSGNPPDSMVTIVVDSTSNTSINGQIKKVLYVHSAYNDWFFLNPIIEDIGSAGGLYPYIYGWMDNDIPYLRCYTDSSIFYQRNINFPCDTLINDIPENEIIGMIVYPNPAHDQLKISFLNKHFQFQITILDSQGRECLRRKVQSGKQDIELDVQSLAAGFYSCILFNEHFKRIVKIIKF